MSRGWAPAIAVVAALAAASGCACEGTALRVEGADGTARLEVCADRAVETEERVRGLRGRDELPPGRGLLMVFPSEGEVCIANAEVRFAIDAIYADRHGRVVALERRIAAGDETARCHEETRYVLEVGGGRAGAVRVGDRLEGL